MLVLSTVSFLIGAALARRFNIFALVPAAAIVLAVAAGISSDSSTAWSIVAMAAATAVSMQIGYLVGMSIQEIMTAASSRSAPSAPVRHPAR